MVRERPPRFRQIRRCNVVYVNGEAVPSRLVKPPRVKESPAALECRHWKTVELPPLEPGGQSRNSVVFGQVIGIHIDDRFVKDGMVDTGAMRPIARLGYMNYGVVEPENVFAINRPEVVDGRVVNGRPEAAFDGKYR